MRVDDVPAWFQPPFQLYRHGGGRAFALFVEAIRRGARFDGPKSTGARPRIECIWHEHLPTYIATYLPPREGRRFVWMNHPVWYMAPVHHLLEARGVESLVLGSSGHGGKRALDRIVSLLKAGCSTALAVDGPGGPAHVLKRGALDMALQSGVELVAIRFEYERAIRLPGWDHKFVPLPGTRVRVIESAPRIVTRYNYELEAERLATELG
jgi:lysophospholipid acyltransferase (LPLAT)-like uncharacterized protein